MFRQDASMNIQVTLSPFGPDILQNGVIGKVATILN
jgi:hypothetical protein